MEDQSHKALRGRKPFVLLAALNPKEVKNFRHYLQYSLLSSKPDEKLLEFFDLCASVDVWNSQMGKEEFQQKVQRDWSDNNFDKLVSRLYVQLTGYVSQLEFAADESMQRLAAIRFYQRRRISSDELEKKWNEVKRGLEEMPQDENFFRAQLEADLLLAERTVARNQRPEDNGLTRLHIYLDHYYCILKLRFLCASANQSSILGSVDGAEASPALLEWLSSIYDSMPLLAQAYFHAYSLIQEVEDSMHSTILFDLLQQWIVHLPEEKEPYLAEVAELYGYLRNHYIQRYNQGDREVLPRLIQTYMDGIRLGWILEQGKLKHETFKNVILLICHLGKPDEARTFFEAWKDKLNNTHEGAAIAYNEAVLKLHERRFAEAIEEFTALSEATGAIRTDQYYGLDIRCHLLKGYFLYLGHSDEAWEFADKKFTDLLHAFPEYLKRRNLTVLDRRRYQNYIDRFDDLFKSQYDTVEKERAPKLKELLKLIRSSLNLPDKAWFIEAIEGFTSRG